MKRRLGQLAREPLAHFLILGAALFAVFGRSSEGDSPAGGAIVVTRGRIEALATAFARTWQRPATESELAGLIRDYVREEASVREAMALGLDRDDTIIRRRLRQKLEFVTEDVAAQAEPTDDDLRAWMYAHPDAFRIGGLLSFSQVHLDPARRGQDLAREAAQLLARLNAQGGEADVAVLGDSRLLEHRFDAVPPAEVRKRFGDKFATALAASAPGRWHGPLESGYGMHLVFVHERTPARMPSLEEAREAVRRDWANARRLQASEAFYEALLRRYTVTIEPLQVVSGKADSTRGSP